MGLAGDDEDPEHLQPCEAFLHDSMPSPSHSAAAVEVTDKTDEAMREHDDQVVESDSACDDDEDSDGGIAEVHSLSTPGQTSHELGMTPRGDGGDGAARDGDKDRDIVETLHDANSSFLAY